MNQIKRFALVCMIVTLVVGLSACDELVSILSTSDLPQMVDDGMTDDGTTDDGTTDGDR